MYKNLIDLFKENEGKGAVGAFNLHCFEMLPSMIHAAEELDVPIIIQTSLGTAEYIGFEPLIAAVKALAENGQEKGQKISVSCVGIDNHVTDTQIRYFLEACRSVEL